MRNMFSILLFVSIFFNPFNILSSAAADAYDDHYQKLTRSLRCLTCQGQSVFESDVPMAKAVKSYVKHNLTIGVDPDQIQWNLQKKYGDAVFFEPTDEKLTIVLWGVPIVITLIGLFSLCYFYLREEKK